MTQPFQGFEKGPLWVLDSTAGIYFKTLPIDRQWEFGDHLLALVRRGELIFPSQVRRELTDPQIIKHPDMPGAWAAQAWKVMKPRPAPSDVTVTEVLHAHPSLVDENAQYDQADPYLVALAVERARAGDEVRVATDDGDLRTACTAYNIVVETADEFVQLFLRA